MQSEDHALREALNQAATWFEEYAVEHYAKAKVANSSGEQHGREVKGETNRDRASYLRAALSATPTPAANCKIDFEGHARDRQAQALYFLEPMPTPAHEQWSPSFYSWEQLGENEKSKYYARADAIVAQRASDPAWNYPTTPTPAPIGSREAEAIWNDALWHFNPDWKTADGFEGSRDAAINSIVRALALHDHVATLAPAPIENEALVEEVKRAIDSADPGYSIKLTSLVDGVSTYTVTVGDDVREFDCHEDALFYAQELRLAVQARAVLALPSIATCKPSLQVQSALVEEAIVALEAAEKRLCELSPLPPPNGFERFEDAERDAETCGVVMQARATLAKLKEGRS